jgi:hypothetical protein
MLEPCALAAWILDPRIDATARISRVLALRYEGMSQHIKAARASGATQAEIDLIANRISRVEQDALALGYPPVRDRKGRCIGIAQPMPSTTELIGSVLNEEKIYRVLSAVSHGHSWAIRQLCYIEVGSEGRFRRFEKQVSIEGVTWQGLVAARSFGRALWHRCLYLGGNRKALAEVLETTLSAFHVGQDGRFWEHDYEQVA